MISFLADENFSGAVIKGLLLRCPELDLVRVQGVGLLGKADPRILEWAAERNRILLTRDAKTLVGLAYERVREGLPMAGVLEVKNVSIAQAIEEILIVALCSHEGEWENQVRYIPL